MVEGTIRDSIWGNWHEKSHNCENCPAHDFDYTPAFAGGDIDSDVMVVLSDPNDDREEGKTKPSKPKPEYESWSYGYSADNGWNSMGYLNPIANNIDGLTDADDLYFTNALKCPTYSDEGFNDPDSRDEDALKQCKPYLGEEIEAVQPEVVVALSKEAIKAIADLSITEFTGENGPKGYVEEWITQNKRYYGSDPAVVAGVHPASSFLHLNLKKEWYGDEKHTEWYYNELGKSVNTALST